MLNDVTVFNIREYLSAKGDKDLGEDELRQLLSEFFCDKNPDVERFLKEQSIEFTKKNQSVTYLVFSNDDASLVGYFTITIKPITVNAENFSNTMKRKIARVSELDEENGAYTLSAYLIAQLGKNFKDGANEKITGEQLLQAAVSSVAKSDVEYKLQVRYYPNIPSQKKNNKELQGKIMKEIEMIKIYSGRFYD